MPCAMHLLKNLTAPFRYYVGDGYRGHLILQCLVYGAGNQIIPFYSEYHSEWSADERRIRHRQIINRWDFLFKL
jgi:hypothetical protein